jgi:hypothetical protein
MNPPAPTVVIRGGTRVNTDPRLLQANYTAISRQGTYGTTIGFRTAQSGIRKPR